MSNPAQQPGREPEPGSEMSAVNVYLALGSNVGKSEQQINRAVKLLGQSITGLRRAPLYRSKAVGYTDQPDFFNTAVAGRTELAPEDLLRFVKQIEQQVGRIARFRWGPREIDIDIIFYGDQVVETAELAIPHLRFSERDFVLRPINDLAPELVDPRSGRTVQELLDRLPPSDLSIYKQV